jgi:hypothetical protein
MEAELAFRARAQEGGVRLNPSISIVNVQVNGFEPGAANGEVGDGMGKDWVQAAARHNGASKWRGAYYRFMTVQQGQTRESHTRLHPPFHFFFLPAIVVLVAVGVFELLHAPGLVTAAQLLLIFVVAVVGFLSRTYALKVQDRLIRLEERLRLSALLPTHSHRTIHELSEQQLISLRFASDGELPALAERARAERLGPKAIKALIKEWRPDYWRV